MRVSKWFKDREHKPRDVALRIADAAAVSDLDATSRCSAPRRTSDPRQSSGFIAMVIAEWHKLVAELSRAFGPGRIHRTAMQRRHRSSLVMPPDTPKRKLPG
jgi:hypothetical protein